METMHNERIRIALMTLAMLLIGAIFAGCGAQKAEAPDLQALYDRILEETDAPTFISITPERLERVYGIRTEDYAQAVFATCEDGLRIDEIWLVETKDEKLNVVLLFGFLVIALMGFYKYSKLKEQGEKRDEDIGDAYYGFTNRLAIYIGAGFTLQKSFRYAIRNEKCMFLVNEIEYTLNMIDSGISEPKAYMELGNRLGLEEYMRLMSLISQNLNFGNSNLLKLLDTEVKTSFFLKKERVRKKGEQASEKLLIPTAILLITVIIVVMFPAFIGMR